MVDETTPESNNFDRPSETLILLVGASASACENACQIIPDDQKNRQVHQKYGPFEVILEYTMDQILQGIWTVDTELANIATESPCACKPANPLVASSLLYELARRLQCHIVHFKHRVVAANPIEEKHMLESLEHQQHIARETLKDVQCSLSTEEQKSLNQAS
jgi:hypothetical protein